MIKRKKVGLALSSGGARALAHIGVIKSLVKHQIPIDFIAGASGGALIGGMYAATQDIEDIEKIANSLNKFDMFKIFSDPSLGNGIFGGENVMKFIDKVTGDILIEQTKIPFRAVATDLITGQPYIFEKGKLSEAVRASSSLPFLFKPFRHDKHVLVDGGVSMPLPVQILKDNDMDIIIGVNLYSITPENQNLEKKELGLPFIFSSSFNLVLHYFAAEQAKNADIVISPSVPVTSPTMIDFVKDNDFIQLGERETDTKIKQIKQLLMV